MGIIMGKMVVDAKVVPLLLKLTGRVSFSCHLLTALPVPLSLPSSFLFPLFFFSSSLFFCPFERPQRSNSTFAQHQFALFHCIYASLLHSFLLYRLLHHHSFCSPLAVKRRFNCFWKLIHPTHPLLLARTSQDDGIVRQDRHFHHY